MQFCINTIRNKTDIDAISFSSAQKVAIICFKKEKKCFKYQCALQVKTTKKQHKMLNMTISL